MKARWLKAGALVLGLTAWAQPLDGGLDGGPDDRQTTLPRDESGSEDTVDTSCVDDRDCDRGFVCRRLVCVPSTRKATPECGGPAAALLLVSVGMVLKKR